MKIEDYTPIVGRDEIEEILHLAEYVEGAKVIHINSTKFGGGVAEILKSLIPLANSVGLKAVWEVIEGDSYFFQITKTIHNALQGDLSANLTPEMYRHYLHINRINAEKLDLEAEVVVVHDPQPLPLVEYRSDGKWVWRCHIDMSRPNINVWRLLKEFAKKYDMTVFTMERYIPKDFEGKILIEYPCIDPLSNKNKPLSYTKILEVLEKYDINPDRPIIGQVARFDKWKNPLGVIDVYRFVKEKIGDVQLLLIGVFAHDDPEGEKWYRKTIDYAGTDRNIHILTNNDSIGDLEVNALQRSFTVALQLSIREGFGLSVTEALWKGVPVIATRVGGIPLQVIDYVTGFLIDDLKSAAEKTELLIKRPWLARQLGRNGSEHVKNNFLITKALRNYLRMHIELVGLLKEVPTCKP